MAKIGYSVTIGRSVEDVFAALVELDRAAEWRSGLVEVEKTSEGPVGVGSTWREVETFLGRRMESTNVVTGFEPSKRFAFKSTSGPIPLTVSMSVEAAGDGTRLTADFDGEIGGFFKLAEPIVMRMARRRIEADFGSLKDLLESRA